MASNLIPIEGIVHEWITSSEVIIKQIIHFIGIINWLKVSIKRKEKFSSFIIESNFIFILIIS